MTTLNIILILTGLITLPLSLILFKKNPKSPVNQSFSIFTLIISLWPVVIAYFRMSTSVQDALFWDRMIYVLASFVPAAIFYFAYSFSFKKNLPYKLKIPIIVLPFILITALFFTRWWIKDVTLNTYGNSVEFGFFYLLWVIYMLILYSSGIWILYKRYTNSRGFERLQLKYVLIAILFPIAIGGAPNAIMPLFGEYRFIFLGPLSTSFMAVSVAYAILKHRLMDIRLVVARSVAYLLLIIALGVIYALGLFIISVEIFRKTASTIDLVTSSLLALVIAFTFQPLKRYFEKVTANIFYKDNYDSNDLLTKLSAITSSTLDIKRLSLEALRELKDKLNVERASVYVLDSDLSISEVIQSGDEYIFLKEVEIKKLLENNSMLIFDELEESEDKNILRNNNISIFIPLFIKKRVSGVVLLSEKSSGDTYYKQDLDVLDIFIPEFAVAISNCHAYKKIKELNKTLEDRVIKRTLQLEKTQAKEIAKAKELLRLKDEFVFIATHDLRTPVTAISGFIYLLKQSLDNLSLGSKENIKAIEDAIERLNQLVDDLLEVARSESGTIKVNVSKINPRIIVENSIHEIEPIAKDKNIKIVNNIKKCSCYIIANEEKLSEVMENLLSNAVKFNRIDGEVKVDCRIKGHDLEISVSDTGCGIPESEYKKVFGKFFKYRNTETKDIAGTGLGLFITRMLVEKMGGSISYKSKENEGTTFTFSLPVATE